jgi:DNA-binding NarL/FixJ family response regulator
VDGNGRRPRRSRRPGIARQLYLSRTTVRNHVSNIFTKVQVADRAQAITKARDAGLGTAERSP